MKYQQLVTMVAFAAVLTACGGKKNETGGGPISSNANPQNATVQNALDLSKITVTNTKLRQENSGLTSITGTLSGELSSVLPCSLKAPIILNKKIESQLPVIALKEVSVLNTPITQGRINTFVINRNGKSQSILGMELSDNSGQLVLGQKAQYSDVENKSQDCTQLMQESYNVVNANGTQTKRSIYRVAALEGETIIKTTLLIDGSKIMGIQLEKKEGSNVVQYCVDSAKLVTR